MKKTIKELLRFQHSYLPIPVNIYKYITKSKLLHKILYKYFILCYDTDFNFKKPITTEFNQKYWLSKRALYWHYDNLYQNRFTHIFEEVFKKYNHLFENKKVCDLMSGIGPYWLGKNLDLMFIEGNKYCCEILKKRYPKSKIINGNWDVVESYVNEIDTLFLSAGCLIYLNKNDVEKFFKITSKIKNFIFIHEGTDLDDFTKEHSSLNYWNFERRLKKYNINSNNSKIYFEKSFKTSRVFLYFIFTLT